MEDLKRDYQSAKYVIEHSRSYNPKDVERARVFVKVYETLSTENELLKARVLELTEIK